MIAAAETLCSRRVAIVSLALIFGLSVFGGGVVAGQWIEQASVHCAVVPR